MSSDIENDLKKLEQLNRMLTQLDIQTNARKKEKMILEHQYSKLINRQNNSQQNIKHVFLEKEGIVEEIRSITDRIQVTKNQIEMKINKIKSVNEQKGVILKEFIDLKVQAEQKLSLLKQEKIKLEESIVVTEENINQLFNCIKKSLK
ncbi:unnamed protein product [Brassicogethes aeneus]|uniref:Uncharacterized protein n=1 Tax=Brassicogethes aeneus TaxID=1431903 RepID=A0A9P0B219_BRAAE|nr:unnamed protein product [Brassicogethes aeneus]